MPHSLHRTERTLPVSIRPAPTIPLVTLFLDRRSDSTRRAYSADLSDFATFLGVPDQQSALACMVQLKAGQANSLALQYRQSLIAAGKSPATINRRLATLRSASKLARTIGAINWTLEIENEPAHSYRDTSGPGLYGIRRMLKAAAAHDNPAKAARDTAILRLLFDLALRRKELVGLELSDLSLAERRIAVVGKGSRESLTLSLPEPTATAISTWLAFRGTDPGPLFVNFDHAAKGCRLTGAAIFYIVRTLGRISGVTARPHGIRHTAITHALDRTGGNVRSVQRFSRHANLQTLTIYDDNRRNVAGQIAELVAGSV
ncbi:MAG: tyrosine-type recombinase/integrase [candidate division Zixibacteria bacterium]|nr:tyrosine-type recombinase/integrase [candidate division Zixibacteria bacterium]